MKGGLQYCKDEWASQVQPIVISLHDLSEVSYDSKTNDSLVGLPTKGDLKKSGIPFIVGDAQSLAVTLWRNKVPEGFDVITSVQTFQYLEDPLAALKGVYNMLKKGGVAFIHGNPVVWGKTNIQDTQSLQSFLGKNFNMSFDGGVVFKKTQPRIHIPVEYIIREHSGELRYAYKRDLPLPIYTG